MIAKHPPEYYIDGLQTYIRGANLVEKASTLVMTSFLFELAYERASHRLEKEAARRIIHATPFQSRNLSSHE